MTANNSNNHSETISDELFDELLEQAITTIPDQFRRYLNEVPVIVEDLPSPTVCQTMKLSSPRQLLGLFHGVPISRQSYASGSTNQIILYRSNILRDRPSHQELAQRIRRVLIHELGHYLGFSEQQLRDHHY